MTNDEQLELFPEPSKRVTLISDGKGGWRNVATGQPLNKKQFMEQFLHFMNDEERAEVNSMDNDE